MFTNWKYPVRMVDICSTTEDRGKILCTLPQPLQTFLYLFGRTGFFPKLETNGARFVKMFARLSQSVRRSVGGAEWELRKEGKLNSATRITTTAVANYLLRLN